MSPKINRRSLSLLWIMSCKFPIFDATIYGWCLETGMAPQGGHIAPGRVKRESVTFPSRHYPGISSLHEGESKCSEALIYAWEDSQWRGRETVKESHMMLKRTTSELPQDTLRGGMNATSSSLFLLFFPLPMIVVMITSHSISIRKVDLLYSLVTLSFYSFFFLLPFSVFPSLYLIFSSVSPHFLVFIAFVYGLMFSLSQSH